MINFKSENKTFFIHAMHVKDYVIDLGLTVAILVNKQFAAFTGSLLFDLSAPVNVNDLIHNTYLIVIGFTAVYRFVKELKSGKKDEEKKED